MPANDDAACSMTDLDALADLLGDGPVVVLTGAGLSTASGIPAYRDHLGAWQHPQPVQHQAFLKSEHIRQRYWARSFFGWQTMAVAHPNRGHLALSRLQSCGVISAIMTQNVDGLHLRAGAGPVIELHGSVHKVTCLTCGARFARSRVQEWIVALNPEFARQPRPGISAAPDGDAHLDASLIEEFLVPPCSECGGVIKPDVVFFGDNVPRDRVALAVDAVKSANALLVVGSTLMVYSGFRFARQAQEQGIPVAAINRGITRADALLAMKIDADCGDVLVALERHRDVR